MTHYLKHLLLCLCLFAGTNVLAYDALIDGIYYNFSGDEAIVTYLLFNYSGNSSAYSGNIVIPPSVNYNGKPYSVTSIGYFAFSSCDSLSSITIPDSVTSIGGHAFQYCKSLTGVTIPDGVTSIEEYVFYDCKSLTSVTIPDTVTFIGLMAFCGCNSLMSITIPDSVTIIGCDAFCGCTSLTNVTIPDSVTSIKSYTFEYCSSLTSITIPVSVTSIADQVFANCSSLTSINIPVSVTSIDDEVFLYCNSLSDIYYQGSESEWNAISIGNYAIPSSVVIHYNSSGIAGTGAQPEYPMHSAPDLAPIGDETEGPAEQTERSAEQSESSGFTRSGLIPGSEAILIVAGDNGSAVDIDSNLLYIAQTAANEQNAEERINLHEQMPVERR